MILSTVKPSITDTHYQPPRCTGARYWGFKSWLGQNFMIYWWHKGTYYVKCNVNARLPTLKNLVRFQNRQIFTFIKVKPCIMFAKWTIMYWASIKGAFYNLVCTLCVLKLTLRVAFIIWSNGQKQNSMKTVSIRDIQYLQRGVTPFCFIQAPLFAVIYSCMLCFVWYHWIN